MAKEDFNIMEENNGSGSRSSSETKQTGKWGKGVSKSTIFMGIAIVVLLGFSIGFLAAWLVERSRETVFDDVPGVTTVSTTAPTAPSGSTGTAVPTITTTQATTTPEPIDIYLPRDILPAHYDLTIEPNHEQNTFTGNVIVAVTINQTTSVIKIHAHQLTITEQSVTDSSNELLVIRGNYTDTERQFHVIELNNDLVIGQNYSITLGFIGSLADKTVGYYRTQYIDANNQIRYVSATTMEPTYARQAFPCFDEPNMKATFNISIIHHTNMIAISNGEEIDKVVIDDTRVMTVFGQTVKMSTYLVAFVVSDFQYVESSTVRGRRIRIYTRPDQINKTRYAMDTTTRMLVYFEDLLGSDYQLNKLDLVALPEFFAGAMENWGLVTFRETNLLYDESESSAAEQKRVASVIAHELAHMWFGNLVTMDWWNEIWLNEGFATYNEYRGVNSSESDWMITQFFLPDDLHGAIRLDEQPNTRPIIPDSVTDPDDIMALFDTVSYSKGASVLRMLEGAVGTDVYLNGIKAYLNKYAYSNAKTEYLWQEIENFRVDDGRPGIPIGDYMQPWTKQGGVPVVSVSRTQDNKIRVTQQRFASNSSDQRLWPIYLDYLSINGVVGNYLLTTRSGEFDNVTVDYDNWIKINDASKGYFVTNYELRDWQLLVDLLKSDYTALSPTNRANLIFDATVLATNNLLPYEVFFDLIVYIVNEDSVVPWITAATSLQHINDHLLSSNLFMRSLIRQLTSNIYSTIGWENVNANDEGLQTRILRSTIIDITCGNGNQDCLDEASRRFRVWADNSQTPILPDIRELAYKYGLQQSTSLADFDRVWLRWLAESSPIERAKLLNALANVRDPLLLNQLIAYANDQTIFNSQEFFTVMTSISGNIIGRPIVWNYVRNNWDRLVDRYTINDIRLGNLVYSICQGFMTNTSLNEMLDFFGRTDAGAGSSARERALGIVRENIAWIQTNEQNVSQWLSDNSPDENPWLNWRLDSRVIPLKYDIYWNIDLVNDLFNGSVTITVNTTIPVKYFVLHSSGLQVIAANAYTNSSNEDITDTTRQFFFHTDFEYFVMPLNKLTLPGVYRVYIEFSGNLTTNLDGLYKSTYNTSDGTVKSMVATQMEPTSARKAFPCFDEPQFKSTFVITVNHSSELSVLSNMPIANHYNPTNGTQVTQFQETVKMVTYLVALAVSDFICNHSEQTVGPNYVVISTCAAREQASKMAYSMDRTPKILDYFQTEYFGIEYSLPKLDNIAIPDFGAGAMENWGLVTYREMYLLFDENESTTRDLMIIGEIIAHELAHQWFGNRVTMRWWDDLWLNEGFATYMTYKAVSFVERSWDFDDHFAIEDMNRVMDADSSPKTHPIITGVQNIDDIDAVFDAITYSKGAAVLRMLDRAIGEENFRLGVQNYLNKYAYQNTLSDDLWTELTATSNLNVADIMDTWIRRDGFPVVTITRLSANNYTYMGVRQERFLKDDTNSATNYNWVIPLTYKLLGGNVTLTWVRDYETNITLNLTVGSADLIKYNHDQSGIYIVDYPDDEWTKWINALRGGESVINQLTVIDRSQFISDAFYLSRAGRQGYTTPLELSEYLVYENSLIPWTIAKSMFDHIKSLIYNNYEIALNYHLQSLVSPLYNTLGWDDTGDANTRRLRTVIIDIACGYQMEECLTAAKEGFTAFRNGSLIMPNLRLLVLKYGIWQSTDTSDWEFLITKYTETQSAQEKLQYLQGLANTRNVTLITRLLEMASDTNIVRSQDFFTLLRYISYNSYGLPIVWNYYRNNYEQIVNRFTINNSNLGRAVYDFAVYFSTNSRLQEVLDFFAAYPNAGAGKAYRDNALELINGNINWINSYQTTVGQWLTTKCGPQTCPWITYRLNQNIVPVNYNLVVQVNTTTNIFNGSVSIEVDARQEVQYFIVHAADILNITDSQVFVNSTGEAVQVVKTFMYLPLQFWVLQLDRALPPDQYVLTFYFNSNLLLGGLSGLYKSTYQRDNETVGLAATQFQSTSARKAFPCFDEPSFRSVFDITIIHDENRNLTISNMPIVSESTDHSLNWVTTRYEPSVSMVSYLVAMLVSDFACRQENSSDGVIVNVCSTPVKEHMLDYSMQVSPAILQHFVDEFESPYQLPKVDIVAIPDFAAGAMENWGLVKFRESYLLWTRETDTSSSKAGVNAVIAHELAHMWFGNLITCQWWSDLWLNEGFASFWEYTAVNATEPDWDYWQLFLYYDFGSAVNADSSANSMPIVWTIDTPAQTGYSSAIVYNKGATVIRMMKFVMNDTGFREGIRYYLKQNAYKLAVTDDLWESLSGYFPQEYGTNIRDFMNPWIRSAGFPYVNVTKLANNTYRFLQQRFLTTGATPSPDTVWQIPISYYTSYDTRTTKIVMITQKQQDVVIDDADTGVNGLIKFNTDTTGMYFVNYPLEDWDNWIDALVNNTDNIVSKLTPQDRTGMIIESFYFQRAQMLPYVKPLQLSRYMVNEDHFTPWALFTSLISQIREYMFTSEYRQFMQSYFSQLAEPQYNRLGWNDSLGSDTEKRLRAVITDFICWNNHKGCLADAVEEFRVWKNGDFIYPNLRTAILRYGIRQSQDRSDWDFLWNAYLAETDSTLRQTYMIALTFTTNPDIIKDFINLALDDRLIPLNEFTSILGYLAGNSDALQIVWEFYQNYYDMLSRKLSAVQLGSVLNSISGYFSNTTRRTEVQNLLNRYSTYGVSSAQRTSAINTITANINWMNTYKDTVGQFFANYSCGSEVCPFAKYRLNTRITPTYYDLLIQVNVTTNVYNGTVKITVNASEDVDYFVVHASSILTVSDSRVYDSTRRQQFGVSQVFRYAPMEYWVVSLNETQRSGVYILEFDFNSNLLLGGLAGLYRSNYTYNNQSYGVASTQFEYTDARKAFPCFDEPTFRTNFTISIVHDAHMNATFSNMPVKNETEDPTSGWVTTYYDESVSMVSYLVAMLVSDYVCGETSTATIESIRICAYRGMEYKFNYALDVTPKIFDHFESYLDSPYQLKKSDLVAIPAFYYGAMENWGLVTFRETALLWHEDEDTSATKMSVNAVIAHELAHQWFGNLVTCQWWSDLWLNEGFASFMEYTAVNASEPDWNYFELFTSDFASAVSSDSTGSAHAIIRTDITADSRITGTSAITYSKGSTVIRMLEFVMGMNNFQTGIQAYLRENAWTSVVTINLWNSLNPYFPSNQYENTTIYEFMNNWTTAPGYPYLNITRNGTTVTVTQQRFLQSGNTPAVDTLWVVPLSYYTSTSSNEIRLIKAKTETIELPESAVSSGLIKFNVDCAGMYFVNYPQEDFDAIVQSLVNDSDVMTRLTSSDRACLIIESFYLQRANLVDYMRPLELSRYMSRENHFSPWNQFNSFIAQIRNYMFITEYKRYLNSYLINLAEPTYNALKWNDTDGSDTTKRLRSLIVEFICWNYHEQCLNDAYAEFTKFRNGAKLAPNLRTSILRYGIRAGTADDLDFLFNRYVAETTSLKSTYLNALTYTRDQTLIVGLITRSMEERFVSTSDFTTLLQNLAANYDALQIVWEFYQNNYEVLVRKVSANQLSNVMTTICGYFSTVDRRTEVQNFFAKFPNIGLTTAQRNSAINAINNNINWMNQYKERVGPWLVNQVCTADICPWTVYRLNQQIVPINYNLVLQVNVTTNIYNGTVTIEVEAQQDVQYFMVHTSSILTVTDSRVLNGGQQIPVVDTFRYQSLEFWVVQVDRVLTAGTYSLQFSFTGNLLLGGLVGIYRSNYTDTKGEQIGLAATQFQDVYARSAFPCFDEPSFKSTFEVTLVHDAHMNATLANMPVASEYTEPVMNWTITRYEKTVPMVTYLVAMVVSDFVCAQTATTNGTLVRICASRVQQHKMDYALVKTPIVIDHFNVYLDYEYQLPKSDLVAIPDFSFGAMENWGLVTFRESALLWHEDDSTSTYKMSVIAIIAHELAHMWFGNLVTCQWWSDLWLNEGFASYMEYTSVDAAEPDWGYWHLFMIFDYGPAVSADSSETSQALTRPVNTPSQMAYQSAIIYQKGATVLRMIEFVMTSANFQTGLQQYLKKFQYNNTVNSDLVESLAAAFPSVNVNPTQFLESWTTQPGFPYLNITITGNTVIVVQERFLSNGQTPATDTLYVIPLSYYTSFDTLEYNTVYITEKQQTFTLNGVSDNTLIKFNTNANGMYFINYPMDYWDNWIHELMNTQTNTLNQLTPSDRTNFILDAFYLSRADRLPYTTPLKLSQYLVRETHLTPWTLAISMFDQIRKFIYTTDYKTNLNVYLTRLAKPQYDLLGWNDTEGNDVTKRLRSQIVEFICSLDYTDCLLYALDEYGRWKSGQFIAPNLLTSTLRYGIRQSSDPEDWNFLWNTYGNEQSATLRLTYLNALSYTTNTSLITLLLNRSFDESLVRSQDFLTVINNIIGNPDGRQLLWNFYKQHYDLLANKLTQTQMGTVLNNICGYFTTEESKLEVQYFFGNNTALGVSETDKRRALETIDSNIDWMAVHREEVGEWLNDVVCGENPCPWSVYRLNENIIPIKYWLTIQVNTTTNVFNGSVTIEVQANQSVDYFIVHAANILSVGKSQIFVNSTNEAIPVVNSFRYSALEFWVIQPNRTLETDTYRLVIDFNSNLLLGGLVGLYKSSYVRDNQTIGVAATQYEATHARKAFPCFDEPAFRSIFETTLIHDAEKTLTITNMPIASETVIANGWVETRYEPSVEMVTYLNAIVVSDFVCNNTYVNGSLYDYNVGICSSPVQAYKNDYALEKTPLIFEHFEQYLDSGYQLPKSDLVAIPDFSAGAMENWGLMLYRETALLWHTNESTSTNKMSVIAVIAHEIAHMWFGNLVTCKWWSDLWLNEGFASFMEYTAVDYAEPDWNYWDLFIIFDYGTAVNVDSSATTHPIVRNVSVPAQMTYTSAILYQKGATVIRMLEYVMTKTRFQQGIQNYLNENEWTSIQTPLLWQSLDPYFPTEYDTNVLDFMDSWTLQAGFPYLNITRNGNSVTVTQQRFLQSGQQPENDTLWVIPLSYYTSLDQNTSKIEFIKTKEETITVEANTTANGLIKFNADAMGFYLVNYPEEDWNGWINVLNDNSDDTLFKLTPSDRTNFIIDSFYLSRANLLRYTIPLELSSYLRRETHLTPWTIAINMFDPLQKYMLTTEYRDDLQAYLSGIAEPIYTQLGWNDSVGNDVVKRLRSSVVEFICFHNYGPCRDRAYDEFTAWKSGSFIAPNLLTTTLKYGIRSGGISDDWDNVWNVYSREQSAVLQLAYLNALSFTTNTTLISLLLNRSLDVTLIRSQDFVTVLNYVAANNEALETLWQFYQNNYLTLSTRLSVANLGNVLNNICVYFSDNTRRAEVVDFLGRYATGLSDSDRVRVLETIDNNIKWMDEHKEEVGQWLRTKVSPWTVFRLNENVIPKKYELYIQVNLTTNVYNGTVSIDVDVNERVDYIKVHAANIVTITDSRVYINSTGEQLAVDNAFSYAANDFWVLRTRQTLAPNSYKLVFDFNGNLLLGGLVGLYRSNYTNSANESIGLAVTKFTQINARKAFPCFDEPAFRSVFDTTVVHDPEKTLTIANMPIANETVIDNGWVATRFEPSVEMVTYLDAFIVSDFECAQTNATYFPIRVCSAPQLTYKSGYALEVTPKIFDHFEAYLGHDYQLPKCDIIALPQYAAGATEKWGIVLFLDNYVLWDENENTATNKMTVAAIIAHEMAHMWFGNLITCKWWSDLWLNEGFASYLEYTSVNASEPDWGYWDIFLMFDYYSAVNADSSPTSHPIVREVNSNAAVTSYTSAIIYQKGSTVLRMLEFVMRAENFRAGLQRYLTDNEWKSIETPSLWLALSDSFPSEYNTTIYEFIDPWVTKAGFPYINITRNANTVSFNQQRYLSNGQPPAIDTVWEIPLTYYTAFDTQAYKIEIIKTKQFSTTIEDADQSLNGLIKFNINSNGMYIVNYPQEDWNNWSDVLTRNTDNIVTKLTPSDRTNFLIDSLFLSRANLVPYLTPLNMSRYLVNERHLTPWTIAINNVFTEVQRYVSITDEYKQDLRTYFSSLAQPVYNNLRWNDSDGTVITQRLRSLIVEFICGNYHLQCLSDALVEFRRWRSGERIGPNLLQSALRYGMRQSNQTDDWYYLWNAYTEQTSQTVQLNYLNALSYTTDSSLINELLYGSLNTSLIPSQYFVNLLNYIAANSDGLELVWGFYQNNYLVLTERLTVTNLGNVLNTICGYFGDDRRKTEVQNFLNQYPNTGLSSSDRLRVIRTIDDNISWMSARKDLVGNWLRELNSNTN